MNRFRLHLLALPHTAVTRDYNACAYTQKILKLIDALGPRGHEIFLYANAPDDGEHSPTRERIWPPLLPQGAHELIPILSEAERASWFGRHNKSRLYDLKWDQNQDYWRLFHARAITELKRRVQPRDFILTWAGAVSQPVGDAFPGSYGPGNLQSAALVEAGCGYYGVFSRYVVYESNSHRQYVRGTRKQTWESNDETVIPNYWDLSEFETAALAPRGNEKQPFGPQTYYLFVGRIVRSKGWSLAIEVTKDLQIPLVIAGQGGSDSDFQAELAANPHVVHVGHVSIAERNRLMVDSIATFCPTHWNEPFGGTAVEAQLNGTPAITTDHGAFCETVPAEWRCASHQEFIDAAESARRLNYTDRYRIRNRATALYSLDAVAPLYERYFTRINNYWGAGWYERRSAAAQ